MSATRILFSDIDGTIMHGPECLDRNAEMLVTPPSASGRQGVISAETFRKVARLREQGIKFVVISGARLSTLLMRLAYLPVADAFVCENGMHFVLQERAFSNACCTSIRFLTDRIPRGHECITDFVC